MLRDNWDDMANNGSKGDWYFHLNDTYIHIRYGDDRMDVVSIPIVGSNAWSWNGSKDKPTITPSIRILGKEGQPDIWHGFLIEGVLTNA